VVIDACAAVALLADDGPAGEWVASQVAGARLAAPDLLPYEAANILRRNALAGLLDPGLAALAHDDLTALATDLYPYAVVARRVRSLRDNLTCYDGAYVALAELLGTRVVTLDARLGRAPGSTCEIAVFDRRV
jgi:predicted nucleic acid-binding protein